MNECPQTKNHHLRGYICLSWNLAAEVGSLSHYMVLLQTSQDQCKVSSINSMCFLKGCLLWWLSDTFTVTWLFQAYRFLHSCYTNAASHVEVWYLREKGTTKNLPHVSSRDQLLVAIILLKSIKNWIWPNPNGPRSGSCDRALRYSGFFGVRGPWGPSVGDFLD